MIHFRTKKELLESMGKKGDDTRSYDRLLAKGLVGHDSEGYYCNDPVVEKDKRIEELEKTLAMYEKAHNDNAEDYNRLLDEFNEYKRKNPVGNNPVEINNDPVLVNSNPEGDTSDLDFQIQENERLE